MRFQSLSVVMLCVVPSAVVAQTTWFVDDDCVPPTNGSSAAPFCTIGEGMWAARNGEIVLVRPGTYAGGWNADLNFDGWAGTVRCDGGPSDCTIDCGGTATDPHRAFIFESGESATSVVQGFTITGGHAGPTTMGWNGGAILIQNNSNPTIKHCTFHDNFAWYGGAIVIQSNSNPTIQDCTFRDNYAGAGGGALTTLDSSPIVRNCSFVNNSTGVQSWGGAIAIRLFVEGAINNTLIDGCLITQNDAQEGGGIYTSNYWGGVSPTIQNCTIVNNWTSFTGGGITAEGRPTIRNCVIANNTTDGHGGGIFGDNGNRTITDCRITDNYAGVSGGGLFFSDGKTTSGLTMINTLVAGNRSSAGAIGGMVRVIVAGRSDDYQELHFLG